MADQDRLGVQLALHGSYLRGEISYDEYNRRWAAGWDPQVARSISVPDPVIVSLRVGDEPQPPRDWPTAIVTRWSGKR
jgi:hypothetical protein